MKQEDRTAVIDHFEGLMAEHGASFKTLGFGRPESQLRRFEVLAEVGDIRGADILDVYCGLADFYDFLKAKDPDVRYHAIEVVPAFVGHIRKARPEVSVEVGDFLADSFDGEWDYVFASGIFYRAVSDSWELMQKSISKMFRTCRVAVAFNSLSAYADKREEGEFFASPERTFAFCKSLTPYVTLRHDYMPHDFTIYMYRK
jgi:hypothetical protein